MITAETITDEQIRELRDQGNFYARVALDPRFVTEKTRRDARSRCAEILNGRDLVQRAQSWLAENPNVTSVNVNAYVAALDEIEMLCAIGAELIEHRNEEKPNA